MTYEQYLENISNALWGIGHITESIGLLRFFAWGTGILTFVAGVSFFVFFDEIFYKNEKPRKRRALLFLILGSFLSINSFSVLSNIHNVNRATLEYKIETSEIIYEINTSEFQRINRSSSSSINPARSLILFFYDDNNYIRESISSHLVREIDFNTRDPRVYETFENIEGYVLRVERLEIWFEDKNLDTHMKNTYIMCRMGNRVILDDVVYRVTFVFPMRYADES